MRDMLRTVLVYLESLEGEGEVISALLKTLG